MQTQQVPLVEIRDLVKYFPVRQNMLESLAKKPVKYVKAVDHISLQIFEGETLGLVGESGCGKSTLSKALTRLDNPSSGSLLFNGTDFTRARGEELRKIRFQMQMIFQDPYSSLNPSMSVKQMFYELFAVNHICKKQERKKEALRLLGYVGLGDEALERSPSQFSGGQRQRLNIARALAMQPRFLIADEPVSALDVSIQAQVINLLIDLQREFHLTMLFISHDMRVVRYLTDRVAVMYLGRIVETGPTAALYAHPAHPYTDILMKAAPVINPGSRSRQYAIEGEIPSPIDLPSGCRFHVRCPYATELCSQKEPALVPLGSGRYVACHTPLTAVKCQKEGEV
jgi:oligopeptide/dipeptide ABC transporter ATP-binding protein